MEFEVGEKVFLKVVTVKGVLKFRKKKVKLKNQFIGPVEILEKVGNVSSSIAT